MHTGATPTPTTTTARDTMTDTVEYLEAQQIEAKIADAMATIVVERPADAAARLAQLLAPAPPPTDKYLDTVDAG